MYFADLLLLITQNIDSMRARPQGSANPTFGAVYSSTPPFRVRGPVFLAGFQGDDVRNGIK